MASRLASGACSNYYQGVMRIDTQFHGAERRSLETGLNFSHADLKRMEFSVLKEGWCLQP